MAGQQQQGKMNGFKSVILFKDQTLGIGSYGKVCRAKCDDLLCAAKLLHETLFDPTAEQLIAPQKEHRLPMRRFEQECELLSTVRHPNIVQHLGIYRDPDTGLPSLLMELMDDSLTHFLDSSSQPIPYHIQVNICHDITLALSFLHSNGIIHRDLSSNNVLLIGNVRAKVTDFGMARLGNQNPRATQLTFTMCPGTDVYMPPEAVKDKPVYTEKIDCFSFGVLAVQIITRQFPKPGDRRKEIQFSQPGLPPIVEVPVSEIERRQNHIDQIDPNHPLLLIALDCLKDRDVERPSAQQLCERVAALKEDPQYSDSLGAVSRNLAEQDRSDERGRELRSLRQRHRQQVQGLQQIIRSQTSLLVEKDQIITHNRQTLEENEEAMAVLRRKTQQLEREKERELRQKMGEINQLERQLGRVNKQLEESERVNAQFQRRITELEQLRPTTSTSSSSGKEQRASIKLTWREGEKAPRNISTSAYSNCAAAVDGNILYVRVDINIFSYSISTSSWSQLPNSPAINCPLVIINNLLTLVGGHRSGIHINQLFSLIGVGSGRRWTEEFPPMPTKRWGATALCIEGVLIVAGGIGNHLYFIQAVEVFSTVTLQWSTAADLPQSVCLGRATVCGDYVYILGKESKDVYTCSLPTLIQSHKKDASLWKEVAAIPVTETTCVSIHGQLLAVGGKDSNKKPTTAIHMYNKTADSWEIISHMGTPRYYCIAAVIPNNQLMVVGGDTNETAKTDSVEFASVE